VIYQLELLQVLVRLAVELEVSLEIGFVRAEFTDVGSTNEKGNLGFSEFGSIHREMVGQNLKMVATKLPADSTVVEMARVWIRLVHLNMVLTVSRGKEGQGWHAGHARGPSHHLHEKSLVKSHVSHGSFLHRTAGHVVGHPGHTLEQLLKTRTRTGTVGHGWEGERGSSIHVGNLLKIHHIVHMFFTCHVNTEIPSYICFIVANITPPTGFILV
jgi:hypothetical protein